MTALIYLFNITYAYIYGVCTCVLTACTQVHAEDDKTVLHSSILLHICSCMSMHLNKYVKVPVPSHPESNTGLDRHSTADISSVLTSVSD
jgi:hypothetical protein